MADGRATKVLTSCPVMNRTSSMASRSVGSLTATSSTEPARANGSRPRFSNSGRGSRPKAASSTSDVSRAHLLQAEALGHERRQPALVRGGPS